MIIIYVIIFIIVNIFLTIFDSRQIIFWLSG